MLDDLTTRAKAILTGNPTVEATGACKVRTPLMAALKSAALAGAAVIVLWGAPAYAADASFDTKGKGPCIKTELVGRTIPPHATRTSGKHSEDEILAMMANEIGRFKTIVAYYEVVHNAPMPKNIRDNLLNYFKRIADTEIKTGTFNGYSFDDYERARHVDKVNLMTRIAALNAQSANDFLYDPKISGRPNGDPIFSASPDFPACRR